MNELAIFLKDSHIYFMTDKTNVDMAYSDFEDACNSVGINIDNLSVVECILRDKNGEDIEGVYKTK